MAEEELELENEEVEEEISEEEEKSLEEIESGIVPELIEQDMVQEVKDSFLAYAMSVIVSRALPDVRDGLKPVHRRIVFGMNEGGSQHDKPFKKSARIVGDVMGKYHPHGDSSIYGALVKLAQPFSTRYPLVDGHGNFGSIDGDGAAAMRYTEARMSKIASEMVRDINKDTVDFMDNYDGLEQEPVVLPSRYPNFLVNGSSGIAVGMATNVPPHNLGEAISAVQAVLNNEDITLEELMEKHIYGPDFPTGAIILGRSGIRKAYETGQGSIVLRSKTHIEDMANDKKRIVITEIPYQVNKSVMVESIGRLARDKVIDGITAVRDESNKKGIRVVVEVRKDAIPEVILNHLFKNTQLQISYGIINLGLVDGEPKILPLKDILKNYADFQCDVVERRTRFDLKKDSDRLHILEGLLTAIDAIDETVHIIRSSKTSEEAKNKLKARFNIDDIQTKAILDMTLSRLVGLEKEKIETEAAQLRENIAYYQSILADHSKVVGIVNDELEEIKNKYSDDRRTEISGSDATIEDEDLIPREELVITLTTKGYIKRLPIDTFKSQNRGGKGVTGMKTHDDDVVDIIVHAETHTDLLFFSNMGKVYRLRGYQVPEFSRIGKGTPIQNLIKLEKDELVLAIIPVSEYKEDEYLFFATRRGTVKRTSIMEFASIRQNGKKAIEMRENDSLIGVKKTNGEALICIAADNCKQVCFKENDVRVMGRSASGVRGMMLDENENAVSITTSLEGEYVLSITEHGYGKMSLGSEYRLTSRGTKGVYTIKETEKTGKLVATKAVNGDEDLIVITRAGIVIRTSLAQIAKSGRNTQGVKIIRINDKEAVSSFAIVPAEEIEENLEEAENVASEETNIEE